MGQRSKHPDKSLEGLIRDAEERGWAATQTSRGYYRLRCPCGRSMTWIHKTPSNPNYEKNKRNWLGRTECW